MKYAFPKGSTSVIVPVFIQDSSSTTGAGLGSLIETSSIVGGYLRPGGLGVALAVNQNVTTEGTYEAPTTAGQVRIGTPANMRTGTYELHFHNDLFATGSDAVFITLGGATNMADLIIEIQLTTVDLNDGVGGGMSRLDAAVTTRLAPTVASRTLDVTATGAAGIDWGNVENKTTANDLSSTDIQLVDTCTTNTDVRGTDSAALASVCTETRLSELDAATGGKMANQVDVIEVDTTSLNDTKIPNTISLANINAEVDTALNTAIPGGPTANSINQRVLAIDDLTQAAGSGDLAAILIDTAEIGAAGAGLTAVGGISTSGEQSIADTMFTRQMTEAYHADGTAPTHAQALHFLIAVLSEFAISGTTITAKKLDGSATAATFTLDDATNPTSRTRAT